MRDGGRITRQLLGRKQLLHSVRGGRKSGRRRLDLLGWRRVPLMTQSRRSWIFAVLFWLLFLASIGLDSRFPLLRTAWVCAGLLFALIASVFSVNEFVHHRDVSGEYVYYRGVPRWMRWFVLDDEEYAKDKERQRISNDRRAKKDE